MLASVVQSQGEQVPDQLNDLVGNLLSVTIMGQTSGIHSVGFGYIPHYILR